MSTHNPLTPSYMYMYMETEYALIDCKQTVARFYGKKSGSLLFQFCEGRMDGFEVVANNVLANTVLPA